MLAKSLGVVLNELLFSFQYSLLEGDVAAVGGCVVDGASAFMLCLARLAWTILCKAWGENGVCSFVESPPMIYPGIM